MHAICGHPVKTTWSKAAKAENFVGWPLLTKKNINKYYPETELPRAMWINNGKMSDPPKPHLRYATWQLHCEERKWKIYLAVHRTRARQVSAIKPANFPNNQNVSTSTSWYSLKQTAMWYWWSPWNHEKMRKWYEHTMSLLNDCNKQTFTHRNTSLTMKYQKTWNSTSKKNTISNWKWHRRGAIDETQPK